MKRKKKSNHKIISGGKRKAGMTEKTKKNRGLREKLSNNGEFCRFLK